MKLTKVENWKINIFYNMKQTVSLALILIITGCHFQSYGYKGSEVVDLSQRPGSLYTSDVLGSGSGNEALGGSDPFSGGMDTKLGYRAKSPFTSAGSGNFNRMAADNLGSSNGGNSPFTISRSGSFGGVMGNKPESGNKGNSPFAISGSGSFGGGMGNKPESGNKENSPFAISGSGSFGGGMGNKPGSESKGNSPFTISGSGSFGGGMGNKPGSGNGGNSPFAVSGSGSFGGEIGGKGGGFAGGSMGGNAMATGGSGAGMPSPFSTANSGGTGNGQGPFSMSSSTNSGNMGGSGKGMPSPFDTSTPSSGGPGGMAGGSFAINMMGSDGPGGLTGGAFDLGTGSNGPGGLAGGAFETSGGSGLGGDNDNSLYDTNKYQAMLQEQFNTDVYEPGLTGTPFSGDSSMSAEQEKLVDYDKNPYYSLGSYSVSSGSGWSGSSSQEVMDAGKGTGANPFNTNSYSSDSLRPFTASHSDTGSSYSGENSAFGGSSYSTGMSGKPFYTDEMLTGKTNIGASLFSTSYSDPIQSAMSSGTYTSGAGGVGASVTSNDLRYGTPFDAPYNKLLSNPLTSSYGNGGQDLTSYRGDAGSVRDSVNSPFTANQGYSSLSTMGVGSLSGPGGNPANQKGSSIGLNLQDPTHQAGAYMTFDLLRRRRKPTHVQNA